MSVAAVFALRVMWTIPTAFVASLGKLESLKDEVPFLARWIEKAPWIVPFAAILAPFVLISLNSALPTLLEYITLLEFPLDQATKIARQFPKLASFMVSYDDLLASSSSNDTNASSADCSNFLRQCGIR